MRGKQIPDIGPDVGDTFVAHTQVGSNSAALRLCVPILVVDPECRSGAWLAGATRTAEWMDNRFTIRLFVWGPRSTR